MTGGRVQAKKGVGAGAAPPAAPAAPAAGGGLSKYVYSLAGLVPAEVPAAHAAILGFTTKAGPKSDDTPTTIITEPRVLAGSFWALLAISILLYAVPRARNWDRPWDFARMLIPPLAFWGWTMIQRTTAFDAVAPAWSLAAREAAGVLGAIVLVVMATALAYKAEN
jgi:hypothetical protein